MNIFKRKRIKSNYRVAMYDGKYVAEVLEGREWRGLGDTGYLWNEVKYKMEYCAHDTEESAQRRLEKFYNPTIVSEWKKAADIGVR